MATRTAALFFTTVALAGCGDVAPLGSGALQIEWRVAPNGCDESEVDVVEIRASGPHGVVERFACSRGEASIVDMTPGTYRVELLGFDANGEATFRADGQEVEIGPDITAAPPEFRLLAAPAAVHVEWTFSNGRVCGANDARWVSISAFDTYDYEVAVADFPCDDGAAELPALRAGSYQLQATALDSAARPVARGTSPIKLSRGETTEVSIGLDKL